MQIDTSNEQALLDGGPGEGLQWGDLEDGSLPVTGEEVPPPPGGSAASYQKSAGAGELAYSDIL